MELLKIIEKISEEIIKNKDYLTELDREIGDGDHGVNLARGFEKVEEEIPNMQGMKPFEVLNKMAMILISNVGGASGALYGTALMKGAAYLKTKDTINSQVMADTWNEMIKGIEMRGKAVLGEKTMLDTQIPAYEAFKLKADAGAGIKECFEFNDWVYNKREEFQKIYISMIKVLLEHYQLNNMYNDSIKILKEFRSHLNKEC